MGARLLDSQPAVCGVVVGAVCAVLQLVDVVVV
jgi:hypothetical protein